MTSTVMFNTVLYAVLSVLWIGITVHEWSPNEVKRRQKRLTEITIREIRSLARWNSVHSVFLLFTSGWLLVRFFLGVTGWYTLPAGTVLLIAWFGQFVLGREFRSELKSRSACVEATT